MKSPRRYFSALILSFIILPVNVFAWNALGHMVVASIAYQNLKPAARDKVDLMVENLQHDYSQYSSLQDLATWPDRIRAQRIESYTHWHYSDHFFSDDGTPVAGQTNTDNAMWALGKIKPVVKNEKANPYERARFLAFLVHIVGDVHQPLHTVARVSAKHPAGDKGGNTFFIKYKGKTINLHKLWDSGVGAFEGHATPDRAGVIANQIEAQYPKAYFAGKVSDLDVNHWMDEGMTLSKETVYQAKEYESPDDRYLSAGRTEAEKRAALAGYRLAEMLNYLLKG